MEVVLDIGVGTGVTIPEGMAERGCVGVGIWEVDREEVAVDDGLLLFSLRPVRRRKRSFNAILSEYYMPPRIETLESQNYNSLFTSFCCGRSSVV